CAALQGRRAKNTNGASDGRPKISATLSAVVQSDSEPPRAVDGGGGIWPQRWLNGNRKNAASRTDWMSEPIATQRGVAKSDRGPPADAGADSTVAASRPVE